MLHTDVINYIAEKIGAKTYLEIGVYNPDHNFNHINVGDKISVDPDPDAGAMFVSDSDNFFTDLNKIQLSHVKEKVSVIMFDLIFIDGLHHANQVRKDIINSWECLNDGGVLIIHDTNPHSEHITHVPRDNREWCGDVYKAIYQIDGPKKITVKEDYGITIVRKTWPLVMSDGQIEWEGFDLFREVILQLMSWEEAKKIIDSWK